MPNTAETSIQKRAPGPPKWRAVATPAMLPVPIVEARAVERAAKDEMVPSPSFFFPRFPNTSLNIKTKYLICGKPRIRDR
jgi:hypothetical protein